jgi:hypothetical protein
MIQVLQMLIALFLVVILNQKYYLSSLLCLQKTRLPLACPLSVSAIDMPYIGAFNWESNAYSMLQVTIMQGICYNASQVNRETR